MMKFILTFPLARYGDADEREIRALKYTLNRLGYYKPDPYTGFDDEREAALFTALNAFQSGHGIAPYDHLMPFDATVRALDKALKEQDMAGRYRWRTVRDDRVRDEHAAEERYKSAIENYELLKFEIEDLQQWIKDTLKNIINIEEKMKGLGCSP